MFRRAVQKINEMDSNSNCLSMNEREPSWSILLFLHLMLMKEKLSSWRCYTKVSSMF